jgi:hypothetical protein
MVNLTVLTGGSAHRDAAQCRGGLTTKCNVTHHTSKTEEQAWRHHKGPAHSQAVSITGRLRANFGRQRANAGFQEHGERYWILLPD